MKITIGAIAIAVAASFVGVAPATAEPAFCANHEVPGAQHTPGHTYIAACHHGTGGGGCDESSTPGGKCSLLPATDPTAPEAGPAA